MITLSLWRLKVSKLCGESSVDLLCNGSSYDCWHFTGQCSHFYHHLLPLSEPLNITFRSSPEIFISRENVTFINLTVETSSDSCCPVRCKWYFNKVTVLPPSRLNEPPFSFHYDDDNKANIRILFDKSNASWLGRYTCELYNKHGFYPMQNIEFEVKYQETKNTTTNPPGLCE